VKYKRPDIKGKIVFTIFEYQNTVLFEIKDNGMGVDKESLPRIFDTLYRADKARSNVRNGSGLGLSICKQIVELHKGLIWAQSEPENGLSIFISLPIYKED
ncbi:MAG: cell wall metabolism sensor histidine kinase WalK, partial [Eubacterium sp.]|nr:cell wall metabolism sensor histidine kinase WalK [Eubacterium sp.]